MFSLAECGLWATQEYRSGKLLTSQRAAGIIIAAGALGDLITAGAIEVTTDRIEVLHAAQQVHAYAALTAAPSTYGTPTSVLQFPDPVEPDDTSESPGVDLDRQILEQLRQDKTLPPDLAIEGLAVDIRYRVARRLIKSQRAAAEYRRIWPTPWRRELVAVALDHRRGVTIPPMAAILNGQQLTDDHRFFMHLVRASNVGSMLHGHLRPKTIDKAIGTSDTISDAYQPLLRAAADLLHSMAAAR